MTITAAENITSTIISSQFEMVHDAAKKNLAGITHEESVIHPSPAGNSLNWVLGHVVATRNVVLQTLGEPPIWTADEAAPYERGAKPSRDARHARRLEDLVAALDRSQQVIVERIRALSAADLDRPTPLGSTGTLLAILSFHEAYHVGQFGLLRRLLGKEGAIG